MVISEHISNLQMELTILTDSKQCINKGMMHNMNCALCPLFFLLFTLECGKLEIEYFMLRELNKEVCV